MAIKHLFRLSFAVVLVMVFASGLPAWGQTRDENMDRCAEADDPDVMIGGCTAFIQSGQEDNKNLSIAFSNRGIGYSKKGNYDLAIQDFDEAIRLSPSDIDKVILRGRAYDSKGNYDRAIQDYDEAIRLNPSFARAFDLRGYAYYDKGNYDRAIQDYDEAIRINPSYAIAFSNRGMAYYANGNYDRAILDYDEAIRLDPSDAGTTGFRGNARFLLGQFTAAQLDFARAVELDPSDAGSAIWLYLARARAGQVGRAELEKYAAQVKLTGLGGQVLNLYLGKAIPEIVLIEASRSDTEKNRIQQHCQAYFYLGEYALIGGRSAEARRLFQQAIDTGETTLTEYDGAKAELKRLPASPVKTPAKSGVNAGHSQKQPAAAAPAAKRPTLADVVLQHLIMLPDYRELQALYDENVTQPGWAASDEGTAVSQWLAMLRSNALSTKIAKGSDGRAFSEYFIGDEKIDMKRLYSEISVDDLDEGFRNLTADVIAREIASNPPDAKVKAALDRFRAAERIKAAGDGKADDVRALLAGGADVNAIDQYGYTALMDAAQEGHAEVVSALLAKGADVNATRKDDNWTALHYAANSGLADVVRILLDKGADVNAKVKNGETALMIAADNEEDKNEPARVDVVRALLAKGADVNAKDEYGETALIKTAYQGNAPIARALIDKGADVNAKCGNGWTALLRAEDKQNLGKLMGLDTHDKGRTEIARMLKDAGAR